MRRVLRLGLGRAHIAREVDDELSFHLAMRIEKLVARGMSADAARAEALRQFGDIETVRQYCVTLDQDRERAMHRANVLDELRQDLAYAVRMLRRNVGFTVVVVLTLALGIGANSAIFTLVDAVLLEPLPVREPARLVALGNPSWTGALHHGDNVDTRVYSYPLYHDVREASGRLVTGLLASGRTPRLDVTIERGSTTAEHPRGRFVSGNYFQVLGVPAAIGRTFDESGDARAGGAPVIVISDGWWTRRFERDPRVIGREIVINGLRLTIIGVASPGFDGDVVGRPTDVWIPLALQPALMPNERYLDERGAQWLLLLGRLAPNVTLDEARTGFTTIVRRAIAAHPMQPGQEREAATMEVLVSSGARGFSAVRHSYATPLVTLTAGVALLLLIICANVANLLLARAVARTREMSVRLAIGARRSRLVRQLVTESMVLALLGALAGLAIAWWGSRLLLTLAAADGGGTIGVNVQPDARVLGFTVALSVLSVALFGLAPALRASRVDLATTMRASAGSVRGGGLGARGLRLPLGAMLVVGQVALSLVLLVGAALLARSLSRVEQVDTGLDRDHLLIVQVDATGRGYAGDRLAALLRELHDRFARIPGVVAVSWSENGIFSGTESTTSLEVPGFEARTSADSLSHYDHAGPEYAHAIGARLLAGRDFDAHDMTDTPRVALVNRAFVRKFFVGTSAMGRTIKLDSTVVPVVGVIDDVRDHELDAPVPPRFYVPYPPTEGASGLQFELRTAGDPASVVAQVRRELRATDASFSLDDIDPLTTLMRQSIREARLLTRLASGFGALALVLAAVGLYGVLTYAVTRRTGEIGLRMALGAQPSDVIGLVLRDALRLVLLGVVIGVPLSFGAARLLQHQLHGIDATDPASMTAALVVLGASAIVAALIPAIRAARVAPLVALRQE